MLQSSAWHAQPGANAELRPQEVAGAQGCACKSFPAAEVLSFGRMLQVNGGNIEAKVDYAYGLFEKPVTVGSLFEENEMIDTIAITKGRGTEGVVTRWGVSRLPRKTHRGLRKVLHASLSKDIPLLPTHDWWHSLHGPFASSSSLLLPASIGDKQ